MLILNCLVSKLSVMKFCLWQSEIPYHLLEDTKWLSKTWSYD